VRVADYHTYFVGGTAWGFSVWAHNAQCAILLQEGDKFVLRGSVSGKILVEGSEDEVRAFAKSNGHVIGLRGTVTGHPTDYSNEKDPLNVKAIKRENEAPTYLANEGYDVHQNPGQVSPKGGKPDYLLRGQGLAVGGEYFDAYAPQKLNLNTLWRTVEKKVLRQCPNIIIIADDVQQLTNEAILKNFTGNNALPGLKRLWVLRGGQLFKLIGI
jgi:Contact-dependent growth inhibition CdiA C-terminal domain